MVTRIEQIQCREIQIPIDKTEIRGDLCIPPDPKGIILFAHGAGSSRLSPRNRHIAEVLQQAGFATLLMDLLSEDEDRIDTFTGRLRFDIPLLAGRVDTSTEWLLEQKELARLPLGYFGASTGAAAALVASLQRPDAVLAIVSRGGRPDLADRILDEVKPATLLIVGSEDRAVLELNEQALKKLNTEKKLIIVPGAAHLFEEPGKLDEVAQHAKKWFRDHLAKKHRHLKHHHHHHH